jgi:hypothetical protein
MGFTKIGRENVLSPAASTVNAQSVHGDCDVKAAMLHPAETLHNTSLTFSTVVCERPERVKEPSSFSTLGF